MSSDEEDERSESEPEQSSEPTEAELALKKRREAQKVESKGLDESAKELLQSNKEERQRMEDEISELRQRNERRKKEREIEEKRLAAERIAEEERRKAAEEEKRRKKEEEEDKKKKERSQRMAEFEKLKNPGNKPNFVISKRAEESGGEDAEEEEKPGVVRKSKEQMEAERKAILSQRIQPLSTDGLDAGKLAEKARELHKAIFRLESEKYDHEKRFKAQQVDMMELAERARQANKVGRGGLKRVQVGADDVDDVQARFSGAPAKIEMYSKYERQTDKRPYTEKKNVYGGPTWAMPIERIRPQKIVRWNEEGLPIYEERGGESEAQAHEEVAA